jgi:lysophospholipase L1-like esterase
MEDRNMMAIAIPGLTLDKFELPNWLSPAFEVQGVILFLGANDAGRQLPVDQFASKLMRIVLQAEEQNLDVVCILVPDYTYIRTQPYRRMQMQICPSYIDIDISGDFMEGSLDGIHWTARGHIMAAEQVEEQLTLIETAPVEVEK